jgi:exonuclease III
VLLEEPNIICLQETKLKNINDTLLKEKCGRVNKGYKCLDAQESRGGI